MASRGNPLPRIFVSVASTRVAGQVLVNVASTGFISLLFATFTGCLANVAARGVREGRSAVDSSKLNGKDEEEDNAETQSALRRRRKDSDVDWIEMERGLARRTGCGGKAVTPFSSAAENENIITYSYSSSSMNLYVTHLVWVRCGRFDAAAWKSLGNCRKQRYAEVAEAQSTLGGSDPRGLNDSTRGAGKRILNDG